MASSNKLDLINIKKYLSQKNIKVGSFLPFNSDASDKVFKVCKTANQKILMLSFHNKPSEYQKYVRATEVLVNQNVDTPEIIDQSSHHKCVVMDYFPIANAAKYFKKDHQKNILSQAVKSLVKLQAPRKKFSGIPLKPIANLIKDASRGVETYIEHYEHKLQIGYYLNRLIQLSIKKNFTSLAKYKPTLTHGDYFLDNFIYYQGFLYVIDHQDLHYNHPHLDIASLIFDARRQYSAATEEKLILNYARLQKKSVQETKESIHLVSLARNMRILGNWVQLHNKGKTLYLKKYRKTTWAQILKHVNELRLWDLREIFQEIIKKTT